MKTVSHTATLRPIAWSAAVLAVALVVSGCGTNKKPDGGNGGRPGVGPGKGRMEVAVETSTIQRISIQRDVDLAGSLVSPDQAKVSSEVAGVVRQMLVELGQEVSAGQVVVRLDPRELELALERAKSQLKQTEAQLGIDGVRFTEPPPAEQISTVRMASANRDDAQAQLRRAQRLKSQNLLSQADLDAAETKVKVTEANYQSALETVQSLKATLQERRHAVTLAQKKLNDTGIRASVAGQVAERLVQQGEFIRENTPVVSIVQMNPLKVKTAIQERHAGLVRAGLPVDFSVESAPGRKFQGKVAYVSPAVDQTTRTFAVEILVDNRDRQLKPGFFAKGSIYTHRDENVMAVSEDAVSTLAGVSNVYVIENGKVRQQMVSIGARIDGMYELLSGLNGDELLASSNLSQLATGTPVKIIGTAPTRPVPAATATDGKGGRP